MHSRKGMGKSKKERLNKGSILKTDTAIEPTQVFTDLTRHMFRPSIGPWNSHVTNKDRNLKGAKDQFLNFPRLWASLAIQHGEGATTLNWSTGSDKAATLIFLQAVAPAASEGHPTHGLMPGSEGTLGDKALSGRWPKIVPESNTGGLFLSLSCCCCCGFCCCWFWEPLSEPKIIQVAGWFHVLWIRMLSWDGPPCPPAACGVSHPLATAATTIGFHAQHKTPSFANRVVWLLWCLKGWWQWHGPCTTLEESVASLGELVLSLTKGNTQLRTHPPFPFTLYIKLCQEATAGKLATFPQNSSEIYLCPWIPNLGKGCYITGSPAGFPHLSPP